ncbi:MAG: hypothetical protein BWY78_00919 [Alphaproteobacteria bacterium ADurb.Bin438]|nr:MAG: hypothetical protein BWY78_00919 [Alphaproteobacteria bacterium ADurb.Bin438]
MSIFGVGLRLALYTGLYMFLMFVISFVFKDLFHFDLTLTMTYAICFWLFIGNVAFIISVYSLLTKFYDGELITDGIFKYSRNPLYASFIIFIAPSITALSGSFTLITTPIFMYFVFKHLIKSEEHDLSEAFGEDYEKYRKKTPLLLLF